MKGIYTVCNDKMLPFLETFLNSLENTKTNLPLYVIPFDQNSVKMEEFCAKRGVFIHKPSLIWDDVGASIYRDEEYRPGIFSRNYFRKLNAFTGPLEEFVFMDVNTVILEDPEVLLNAYETENTDIIFLARSVKQRTLRDENFSAFLNKISPGILNGYSAAFFISRRGLIDEGVASILSKNSRIRRVFGKAPEQGFLNYALALIGCTHSTLNKLNSTFQAGFWKDRFKVERSVQGYVFSEGPCVGQKVFVLKWTGQDINSNADGKNFNLLKDFMNRRAQ